MKFEDDSTPYSVEHELHLLRFPTYLRQQLDGLETEQEERAPTAHHAAYKARSRPWVRRFRLLLLFSTLAFGLIVWSLETEHQRSVQRAKNTRQLRTILKNLDTSLGDPQRLQSLPRALKHQEDLFLLLHKTRNTLCRQRQHTERKARWKRIAQRSLNKLQTQISRLWQARYEAIRKRFVPSLPLAQISLQTLCQQQLPKRLTRLKQQLLQSSKRLLTQASLHLRWYGWCSQVWSRLYRDPSKRQLQQTLRKNPCAATCRRSATSCRRCVESWRSRMGLSSQSFQTLREAARFGQQRRCNLWEGKSAWDGVFHFGAYYWRVKRVLAYTNLLESYGHCDAACQKLRNTWGFRLTLQSKPKTANLYIQLWPARAQAPTQVLRNIHESPQGKADGKTLWLPALRTDLLQVPPPRGMWYLFYLHDPKTKRRALLPLAPQPGSHIQRTLSISPLQIHNDGRQPLRFASISDDGSFLSFATYRLLPWEKAMPFAYPHCLASPPQQPQLPWRSLVSLYALDQAGQPSSKGKFLPLPGWLHDLRLAGSTGKRALLLSLRQNPSASTSTPQSAYTTVWKIPIHFDNTKVFGQPQQLANPTPRKQTIPLSSNPDHLYMLRLQCPPPDPQPSLVAYPPAATKTPRVPQGYHTVHAAQMPDTIAFLLAPLHKPNAALFFPPRPPISLQYAFRQLRRASRLILLAGGSWGAPLQVWNGTDAKTLLPGSKDFRYLDPALHPTTQRLFTIQQWNIPGHSSWKPTATFLISRSAIGKL